MLSEWLDALAKKVLTMSDEALDDAIRDSDLAAVLTRDDGSELAVKRAGRHAFEAACYRLELHARARITRDLDRSERTAVQVLYAVQTLPMFEPSEKAERLHFGRADLISDRGLLTGRGRAVALRTLAEES